MSELSRPSSVGRPPDAPHRPRRRGVARPVLLVLGLYLVLGLVAGVVWWQVAPTAEFVKLRNGSGSMGDVGLGRQFDADGWYVVVAGVAGLLSGLVLMAVTIWRRGDELVVLPAMLVGSVVAALVMARLGHLLGPDDPAQALAGAAVGARVPDVLSLTAQTAYLTWPVAVLFGALMVLLGPEPASDAAPGPTPDPAASRGPA